MYLRCKVLDEPKKWKSWLAQAEFWYNTSFHTTLGCSPFVSLYVHEPNIGVVPTLTQDTTPVVGDTILNLQAQAMLLKEHLARAQNKMKLMADKKRTDREFQIGDSVLPKL